ncbi:carboxy-S-adenosyl-L-methionine synthase CmoA [Terasakiispira papahanaumokuakeensis]|uniref:Carboxy-S-adenosyl-L-methionine synthase n=1 Tax=Terasakiispira papahanaumokuakeensis TaxID=197479 RepID=A0A1E2V6I0_9GAMM|nr:carboxy-S-adenosyl-L-methionine synthase CmoA [Terasakiispira papahanaumokuakeensis]ODC02462.1 carboxy-S-adenosyl-L-methionine synthase CmoA [Terasakiispira papahanaumokuakeensis]
MTQDSTVSFGRDALYVNPLDQAASFSFDEQVARVFPDMIKRSVPGYSQIIGMLGVIARQHVKTGGRVYDLGASLGAATLSVGHQLQDSSVELVAVDNAPAMVTRCREVLQRELPAQPLSVIESDIRALDYKPCDLVILNFTLQFLPPEDRTPLLQKLYAALKPGGALIVGEKIHFADEVQQQWLYELHHDFKRANGYSDMEISQKRSAIEDVLRTDTADDHLKRLTDIGFIPVTQWFQYLNFAAFLAIKPSQNDGGVYAAT